MGGSPQRLAETPAAFAAARKANTPSMAAYVPSVTASGKKDFLSVPGVNERAGGRGAVGG